MSPHNVAQRRFLAVVRASMAVKLLALLGFVALAGAWGVLR